ncbi:MAG: hypothetical protein CMG35_00385 [Candidatus Marinimicrobia bacterium]|nr:hypothetical protein [Candidatus Neomarinimicrobiota bacterium]|tara:strand:+ start:1859 stop:2434 length:576 start_codon:yes stop_codon:yes gene_type:complete
MLANMFNDLSVVQQARERAGRKSGGKEATADQIYSDILRQDYEDYINNFRGYEERLLALTDDTSIVDNARESALTQSRIAGEIQARNLERYGGAGMSAVQRQQQQRAAQRGDQLTLAGTVNNARVAQREVNQALLSELIGIGQGVNASALAGLGTAAQNEVARRGAYRNARSQYRSALIGGGTAVLAAFGI